MDSNRSRGSLTIAYVYIAAVGAAGWLFDAEGLRLLDQLTTPAFDRSVSGVERPAFHPGIITTMASGHVVIVRALASTKKPTKH